MDVSLYGVLGPDEDIIKKTPLFMKYIKLYNSTKLYTKLKLDLSMEYKPIV